MYLLLDHTIPARAGGYRKNDKRWHSAHALPISVYRRASYFEDRNMSQNVPAGLRFGFQQCAAFIYVLAYTRSYYTIITVETRDLVYMPCWIATMTIIQTWNFSLELYNLLCYFTCLYIIMSETGWWSIQYLCTITNGIPFE